MGQFQVHQQEVDFLEVGAYPRQQLGGAAREHRAVPGAFERGHEAFTHEGCIVRDQHRFAGRGR
jgi:hypothetical protein